MDVPGMVMTSSSEPVLKSIGGHRVVNEPQKLHRKIKENKITPEYLKEHCRRHDLYMTPRFNTVLYLHHKVKSQYMSQQMAKAPHPQGLKDIENLEEYSGLKCLWLESNVISEIKGNSRLRNSEPNYEIGTGLDHLQSLKCLYLHENRITEISVGSSRNSFHKSNTTTYSPRVSQTWWLCPT